MKKLLIKKLLVVVSFVITSIVFLSVTSPVLAESDANFLSTRKAIDKLVAK